MDLISRALIASTWIGLLIALIVIAVTRAMPSSRARYTLLLTALLVIPLTAATYAGLASAPAADLPATGNGSPLLGIWALGATLASSRMLVSWLWLRSVVRRSSKAGADLNASLKKVARALGMSRAPELRITDAQLSPCTAGVLRAVVLLPAAAASRLSPAQIEAVLMHELAHIRRWDYWANALQLIVESLLFFHPAVWVLSRMVSIERELCCDDVATSVLGDRMLYARSLAAVAVGRRNPLAPAADVAIHHRLSRLVCPGSLSRPAIGRGSAVAMALSAVLAILAISQDRPRIVFARHELPPTWTAAAQLRNPSGLIEINLRTKRGDATILLEQPTPKRPRTWFTVTDGRETIRYEGALRPTGQIVFRRTNR